MSEELNLEQARWLIDHKEYIIQKMQLEINALTAEREALIKKHKEFQDEVNSRLDASNERLDRLDRLLAFANAEKNAFFEHGIKLNKECDTLRAKLKQAKEWANNMLKWDFTYSGWAEQIQIFLRKLEED